MYAYRTKPLPITTASLLAFGSLLGSIGCSSTDYDEIFFPDPEDNGSEIDVSTDVGPDAGSEPDADTGATVDDAGEPHDAGMGADASVGEIDWETSGLSIAGTWETGLGPTTIGPDAGDLWGSTTIVEFHNASRVVIRQNPDDAEYHPGQFSRVVWTDFDADGGFYYCTVEFDLDTLEEARASDATADDSDPEAGGCGGFTWSYLAPATPDAGA